MNNIWTAVIYPLFFFVCLLLYTLCYYISIHEKGYMFSHDITDTLFIILGIGLYNTSILLQSHGWHYTC